MLVGPPNVGKSSLFNALTDRFGVANQASASAIVSPTRGTTRDYLTGAVELRGQRCELIDTAGVEADASDSTSVTEAAQRFAAERRDRSVVRVLCIDGSSPETTAQLADATVQPQTDVLALTKSDIAPRPPLPSSLRLPIPLLITSSATGEGLDELAAAIAAALSTAVAGAQAGCVAATADRCRDSVRLAEVAIYRAAQIAASRGGDELIAAEVRVALAELGKVVGAVYTDDLLDRIFKSFCIGK